MATLMEFRGEGNQHKWDGQGRLPGGRRASAGHQRAGRTQVKEEGPSGGEGEGTGFGMEPRGSGEPAAVCRVWGHCLEKGSHGPVDSGRKHGDDVPDHTRGEACKLRNV